MMEQFPNFAAPEPVAPERQRLARGGLWTRCRWFRSVPVALSFISASTGRA